MTNGVSKTPPYDSIVNVPVILSLSLSSFIGPFGGFLLIPVLKEISIGFNIAEVLVGLAITLYMIPFSFFQLFSGYISDKYNRKNILLYGSLFYTLGGFLSYISPTFTIFLLTRIVQGLGSALMSPTTMALVGDFYNKNVRGKVMGLLTAAISFGGISGAILGGYLGTINWRYIFLSMTIMGLILTFLIFLSIYDPRLTVEVKDFKFLKTYVGLIRNPLVIAIGLSGAIVFFTRWSLNTFISYVVRNPPYNLSPSVWGNIASLAGWGSLAASFVAGYLTDKLGRKNVIRMGFTAFLIVVIMFLSPYWFNYLALLYLASGFCSGFIFTPLGTLILEVKRELRGTASSIYGSLRFLGYALGPVLPIPIYVSYGLKGVIILDALLIIFAIIYWIAKKN